MASGITESLLRRWPLYNAALDTGAENARAAEDSIDEVGPWRVGTAQSWPQFNAEEKLKSDAQVWRLRGARDNMVSKKELLSPQP